jgi:ribosome-associated protein
MQINHRLLKRRTDLNETKSETSKQHALALRIAAILEEKNAKDIETITVEGKTVLADYFVIATGSNVTHLKTLADEILFKLKEEQDLTPHHTEGEASRRWILLDFGDVVVHLFMAEERDLYKLEKLWQARPKPSETKPEDSVGSAI